MDKKQSIVVEFVGPPGGGKTTNCNSIRAMLVEQGIQTFVFADVKKHLYKANLFKKMLLVWRTTWRQGKDIVSFIFFLLRSKVFSFDSFFRYCKLCLFNQSLQDFRFQNPGAIIVLDQWVIQGLWSATIFRLKHLEKATDRLKRFYFPVDYIVYFDVDIETAAKRVGTRSTETSRFDRMPEVKRLEVMREYNDYLMALYQQSTALAKWKVSTLVSPQQNAIDFIQQLKKIQVIN